MYGSKRKAFWGIGIPSLIPIISELINQQAGNALNEYPLIYLCDICKPIYMLLINFIDVYSYIFGNKQNNPIYWYLIKQIERFSRNLIFFVIQTLWNHVKQITSKKRVI